MDLIYLAGIVLFAALIAGMAAGCNKLPPNAPANKQQGDKQS